jgi:glucose/arabinose dehydrogenase
MKSRSSCFHTILISLVCLGGGVFGAGRCAAQSLTGLAAIRVASGLTQPLFITAPPGDTKRLFIVCQTGQIHILNLQTGALNATNFLDISAQLTATTGEQGLLGLAFDPNYATNGKFYLNFVVPGGAFGNGTTHVSQFQVSATNVDVADLSNEKILITFDHPYANHNGGWIAFSPRPGDGNNLYIDTGDGGNANDQGTGHIEPGGNAQNNTTVLGKVLRLHINSAAGTASVPTNNPFAGSATLNQNIWAYGLRNPFRASFDRATGNLFIGDVGQSTREEVDVQKATNPGGGENYGWRLREGTIEMPVAGVGGPEPTNGVDPIIDYPRSTGGCIIGGYVYRGRQIPALTGTYVFGDYLNVQIFSLKYDGTNVSNFQTNTAQLFPTSVGGFNLSNPSSFGEDANGELYIADIGNGSVFKIVPTTPEVVLNTAETHTNGHVVISGYGVPFKTHNVTATTNLTQSFTNLGTTTADGSGAFQFEDTASIGATNRYYRVVYP